MNTRRIGKRVIVLFLLAALPGLTAVMAQEERPAENEPSPVPTTEIGESAPPTANVSEVEPDNTSSQSD